MWGFIVARKYALIQMQILTSTIKENMLKTSTGIFDVELNQQKTIKEPSSSVTLFVT